MGYKKHLIQFSLLTAFVFSFYSLYNLFSNNVKLTAIDGLSQVAAVSSTGLITNYTFDEGGVSGKIGNARNFNGSSDYVNLGALGTFGDNKGAMMEDGMTFSIWFKTSSPAIANIIGNNSGGTAEISAVINENQYGTQSSGALLFKWRQTSGYGIYGASVGNSQIYDGNWHNWTVSIPAGLGSMSMWLDGAPLTVSVVSTGNSIYQTWVISPYLAVGALVNSDGSLSRYFPGTLDDLRLYSRALTPEEVMELYNYAGGTTTTNQPPTVFAGSNQTITLPSSATFSGTASDDGLPLGSSLTTTWSKVSGSGMVTFSNPSSLDTTTTFSESGIYILRLTASDTSLISTSDITVTVNSALVSPPTVSVDCSATNIRCVDDTPGSTQEYSTIQACSNVAQAGDTCLIWPGNYIENLIVSKNGSAGNYIIFRAKHPFDRNNSANRSVIKGQISSKNYNKFIGLVFTDGQILVDSDWVEIAGNQFNGTKGSGTWSPVLFNYRNKPFPSHIIVKDNYFRDVLMGMHITCGDDCLIENNEIYHMTNNTGLCDGVDADYVRMFGNGIIFRNNKLHGTISTDKFNGCDEYDRTSHTDGIQTFNNGGLGGQGYDTLTNTTIEGNVISDFQQAIWWTSVMAIYNGQPMLTHHVTVRNNVFINNWGSYARIAIGGPNSDEIYIYNNVFAQSVRITAKNRALIKNNIFVGGFMNTDEDRFIWPQANYEINNNILLDNNWLTNIIKQYFPEVIATNMLVSKETDIFVDPANWNYQLKAGSLATNAGANLSSTGFSQDILGTPRPQGTGWDIGAYEYTGTVVNPPPTVYTPGDFNRDGIVNAQDFSLLKLVWNQSNTTYDLNTDGIVNSLDYVIMVRNWTG